MKHCLPRSFPIPIEKPLVGVDGGGKRGQNSGGLVTFHSAPFPLGRGCSLRTARSGQGRAGVARRSEPLTARTVLRSSCKRERGGPKWTAKMAQSLTASDMLDHMVRKARLEQLEKSPYAVERVMVAPYGLLAQFGRAPALQTRHHLT